MTALATLLATIPNTLLGPVIATVVACLTVAVYLIVVRRYRHNWASQAVAAGEALSPYLIGNDKLSFAVMEAIEEFGRHSVMTVLRTARLRVKGRAGESISDALAAFGEVKRLRRLAASPLRAVRLHGLWGLGECGGDDARRGLLPALDHPDPQTRMVAREALVAIGSPADVAAAMRSYLRLPTSEIADAHAFLRAAATRDPETVRSAVFSSQSQSSDSPAVVSLAHRAAIEAALEETGVLPERTQMDTRALELAGYAADRLDQTDLLDNSPIGSSPLLLEEEWPDERAPASPGPMQLHLVGSEVAFGAALLLAAVVGGSIAWILS